MAIELKTPKQIQKLRRAGRLAAETLVLAGRMVRPGLTTDEINTFVHAHTLKQQAWPAPLQYKGFPKSVCTSVNEVVCHGIPGPRVLEEGDIVNIDVTTIFPAKKGFYGDTSATFFVGEPSPDARHVTEVARRCLELGIAAVRPGGYIGDIGAAIQEYAEGEGCSVVRDFVGHGIGTTFHTEPSVPHFGRRGEGPRMRPGMVFTIEPMINLGGWETEILPDRWTAVTVDGSLSAQFEHTVAVTETGCEVLTRRSARLDNSEDRPWVEIGPLSCWVPGTVEAPEPDEA